MRKLIILLLILSSCKKEVYYYPSQVFFEEYNPTEIIIDNLSFYEVTDSISNGLFRKEKYFLTIVDEGKEYRISPFTYTGGYIKEKNALEIVDDSIYVSVNKFPLTQLSKYLKRHYENNGKSEYLSDSYKRAFVKLVLEPKDNSEKLKSKILYLFQVYNQAIIENKDSIQLHILFDYPLDISKIPPPPIIIEN